MRVIFSIIYITVAAVAFIGCSDNSADEISGSSKVYQCPMKCEGEKTYSKSGSCVVCNMDIVPIQAKPVLSDEISEESIFNLTSKWTTQNNQEIEIKALKGKVLVVVMIYTSCKAACPRLVADMRNIQKEIGYNDEVNYVMVSIDPETDTPERLKEFAIENEMDNEQWTFLNGSIDDVRELANVLAVKYKAISPIDFSHSNIISVFNQGGEIQYQEEGLGVDNKGIIKHVNELIKKQTND
ncbi:MAG: SCO family protein [Salibacteraceae bacterium]